MEQFDILLQALNEAGFEPAPPKPCDDPMCEGVHMEAPHNPAFVQGLLQEDEAEYLEMQMVGHGAILIARVDVETDDTIAIICFEAQHPRYSNIKYVWDQLIEWHFEGLIQDFFNAPAEKDDSPKSKVRALHSVH